MASETTLMGLLKTPSQVRKESQERLMQESLARSQQMITGGGTTALPGILSRYGAQAAQRGAMAGAGLLRGVTGGLGQAMGGQMGQRIADLGVPVEERQARDQMQALEGLQMNNVNSMKQALKRLQDTGGSIQAQLALSDAIAKREKELLDRSAAARGEQLQRDLFGLKERQIELDEAKFAAEKLLGGTLGQFDLNTETGVNEAVKTLMSQGKTAEAVRLKNAFKKEQSAAEKAIEYFASNFTNGDREKAYQMYIDSKRTDPMVSKTFERLETEYDKAIASTETLKVTNQALQTLDSGRVITGSFPNTRKGAEKLVEQIFGLDTDGAVARTELLMSQTFKLAGQMLASGMFGEGTGISERDLLTAQEIAGAANTLTPAGMEQILRINGKMQQAQINAYNKRLDRFPQTYWERSPIPKDSYIVTPPELYENTFRIPQGAPQARVDGTDEIIYSVDGKWYYADGTEYTVDTGE